MYRLYRRHNLLSTLNPEIFQEFLTVQILCHDVKRYHVRTYVSRAAFFTLSPYATTVYVCVVCHFDSMDNLHPDGKNDHAFPLFWYTVCDGPCGSGSVCRNSYYTFLVCPIYRNTPSRIVNLCCSVWHAVCVMGISLVTIPLIRPLATDLISTVLMPPRPWLMFISKSRSAINASFAFDIGRTMMSMNVCFSFIR